MDIDKLITMANRIAQFFSAMPDQAQAQQDVALHLKKFWEPRMRLALIEALASGQATQLHPLAREALSQYEEQLKPQA